MNSAIIVAGGVGKRFLEKTPKQFTKLKGKEILAFSVETFINHQNIDEVIIVSHLEWIEHVSKIYSGCKIVEGGRTRQESVFNGINHCSQSSKNVLIHDAARPFISSNIITSCLQKLEETDAVAPVMDSSNSLVEWDNGTIKYVDRSKIKEIQTPQCFQKKIILDALKTEYKATDEIGLLLLTNSKANIKFVPGSEQNRKITSKYDMIILESYINQRIIDWI
tara:strand:- start:335 stop:1000 length:666 start_codon:yes stop_codon:yes gene_type:complete